MATVVPVASACPTYWRAVAARCRMVLDLLRQSLPSSRVRQRTLWHSPLLASAVTDFTEQHTLCTSNRLSCSLRASVSPFRHTLCC